MQTHRPLRRWAAALVACLVGPSVAAATPPLELEVKAAYLAKFAPFVVWPQSAFASPSAPLVLCVQGDDPFGGMLDKLAAGQNVGAHPVVVRRMARLAADSNGKGIVRLVLIDGRVRFMIDAGRAGQSGLAISSKLLALAAQVKR